MTWGKQIVSFGTSKGIFIMSGHTRPHEAIHAIFVFSLITGIFISLSGFALEIYRVYQGLKYGDWSKTYVIELLPAEIHRTLDNLGSWLGIKQIIFSIIQTDISIFLVLFGMFWVGLMILLQYLVDL